MPFYDRIAEQWDRVTGHRGGALKELVLNDVLVRRMRGVDGLSLLEVGAGNGYFLPLALRRFSGQLPSAICVTDQSDRLIALAKRHFRIDGAEYRQLDIRGNWPWPAGRFDLVLATMVFNELPARSLRTALFECSRVLAPAGRLIATVLHPQFVRGLERRGLLRRTAQGRLTMPTAGPLRVPVALTSQLTYRRILHEAGFEMQEEVAASAQVRRAKPGLRATGGKPVALVFDCQKRPTDAGTAG